MSEMFQKSIGTLELPRVLQMLSQYAVCEEAKRKAQNIFPVHDKESVVHLLDETDAAKARLGLHGSPSFDGVKDVAFSLQRAEQGGVLNTKELLEIMGLLYAARRVSEYDNEKMEEKTCIDHLFSNLRPNRYLEDKIRSTILDEENIADSASPELADIRRKMRVVATKGRTILQKIISSPSYAKILQEALITQRDGRFVVPVKAECKGSMPGLVHDVSSSGATVFVEPMGVVNANNELRELKAKEEKEIDRILCVLSAECAEQSGNISYNYDLLVHLDLIFARAQLSYQMNATRPDVSTNGGMLLRKARHPLLDSAKAVPISVEIGKTFDTLVITGPNTGGKTVTLKTLGLLTLMAQCGLHIPAEDGSVIRIFHRILADIGDEQSIEQSLSTFSSHMANTVEILKEADKDTLVLFDELGAGTDPVEGAALAIAIIQHARRKGAMIAATTHYAELKTFAMTTSGVENASCEFDVQTLRPTYKLLIGIPGKSNAFAISSRLGLDDSIIEEAKNQMTQDSLRFEDVLAQLEEKRQRLEKAQTEVDRLYIQREEDARKARTFREQMEKAKENARQKGEAEAKRIVREAEIKTKEIFEELDELKKQQIRNENFQQLNDSKAKVKKNLREANDALHLREEEVPVFTPSRPFQVGDVVEIPGVRQSASVLNVNDDGTLLLMAGKMKMTVKSNTVRLIEDAEEIAKKKKAQVSHPSVRELNTAVRAASELDIRGMETLEAEGIVENYIDSAIMAKLNSVTIIHGKGTGALRKAVHEYLKKNKQVKSFRLGTYGEGDAGVTIVELRS